MHGRFLLSSALVALPTPASIAIVLTLLAALALGLRLAQKKYALHPEWPRKLLHIGMGLLIAAFPWIFERAWPVSTLCIVGMFALLATRFVPALRQSIGQVTGGVARVSLGEIYYPVAIAVLAPLAWKTPVLFVVPVLVLVLADALAALIGITYGRLKYQTSEGTKSLEGSIAFFAVSFLSVHVPLLLMTDVGRAESLLIAVIIGLLSMMFEAIAWRGIDNLIVPLAVYALLRVYLPLTPGELWLRVALTLAMTLFVMLFRRRATLDDSALIACALFGFGLLTVGGPVAIVAPMTVFIGHVGLFPRHDARRATNVGAIAAIASTPLVCLLVIARTNQLWPLLPLAVAMAAHWAFVWISYATPAHTGSARPVSVVIAIMTALLGVVAPTFAITSLLRHDVAPMTALLVALQSAPLLIGVAVAFALARRKLYLPTPHPRLIHTTGGVLAGFAAAGATVSYLLTR
ncbi:MAG: hypothetical protein QM770_05490 [Tepidisphaeraceae bacterium]